jgi:prepilin-type N-terminal cleavage/methylation domain-containing protein
MTHHNLERGFSIPELLVVVAIIGIIASVSLSTFKNMHTHSALRAGGQGVYDALLTAREDTLASRNDTVYGVRISSTTVTRFTGSAYSAGSTTNKVYYFENGTTATGTLVTSGTDIVFRRLTGLPSATGTIYVRNSDGSSTTTLLINGSGLVEFQ